MSDLLVNEHTLFVWPDSAPTVVDRLVLNARSTGADLRIARDLADIATAVDLMRARYRLPRASGTAVLPNMVPVVIAVLDPHVISDEAIALLDEIATLGRAASVHVWLVVPDDEWLTVPGDRTETEDRLGDLLRTIRLVGSTVRF